MKQKRVCFHFLFSSLLCNAAIAQTDTAAFRNPANYQAAVDYYSGKIQENTASFYGYYQTACYLSLLQQSDSAFPMLLQAIRKGAAAEDILTDTDFSSLHNKTQWNNVVDTLKKNYLLRYPNITHPELSLELWFIWIKDQRFRTLTKNIKNHVAGKVYTWKIEKDIDRIEEIIQQYGWPTHSMVGEKSAEAVFLVIQHSMKIKKYLPLMIRAANNGEADRKYTAMMIDRYLSRMGKFGYRKKVQIFGSQAHANGYLNKATSKRERTPFELHPIADEEHVNLRRAALGMTSIEENSARLGVNYIPLTQREDYKPIKIKKRWIRKGYLLGTENF
ncbi:MAG: hypothetical protein LBV41_05690 [Cytophagaceae bacterium]|jgi:hypothetical protein|nr:hypothetical protein [Cytophagaceae bacterium]